MLSLTRRVFLLTATALCLPVWAAWSPEQPVKLVVTTAPGTGSDTIARMLGPGMNDVLGQAVVVDNRPGAGGAIGMTQVARAQPDGYTIVLGANGTLVAGPLLNPTVTYRTERDFVAVAGVAKTSFVIVTANTDTAPKSIEALVELTKTSPTNYGSSGVGTVTHLSSELFLHRTGGKATHIPYKGSNQSLADVIAGNVQFVSDTLPAVLPLIRGGKLRALAITSAERSASLPDVPTLAESGYPDLIASAWWGLVAPAKTPPEVVDALSKATLKALQRPEVVDRLKGLDLDSMYMTPEELTAFIRSETPMWADLIKQANLKVE